MITLTPIADAVIKVDYYGSIYVYFAQEPSAELAQDLADLGMTVGVTVEPMREQEASTIYLMYMMPIYSASEAAVQLKAQFEQNYGLRTHLYLYEGGKYDSELPFLPAEKQKAKLAKTTLDGLLMLSGKSPDYTSSFYTELGLADTVEDLEQHRDTNDTANEVRFTDETRSVVEILLSYI